MAYQRADVVAAALEVLADHGLESCSMRRIAQTLGVQPSALYHHVPDKQTLLALMAGEIVGAVAIDLRLVADPGTAARAVCLELRAAMLSIRDGADVVSTAAAFRLGDARIEFELRQLLGADAARTLLLYTYGHTQATQAQRQAAEFGVVAEEPGLDEEYARGLDLILAGIRAVKPSSL